MRVFSQILILVPRTLMTHPQPFEKKRRAKLDWQYKILTKPLGAVRLMMLSRSSVDVCHESMQRGQQIFRGEGLFKESLHIWPAFFGKRRFRAQPAYPNDFY
jgi:hypothetical protein